MIDWENHGLPTSASDLHKVCTETFIRSRSTVQARCTCRCRTIKMPHSSHPVIKWQQLTYPSTAAKCRFLLLCVIWDNARYHYLSCRWAVTWPRLQLLRLLMTVNCPTLHPTQVLTTCYCNLPLIINTTLIIIIIIYRVFRDVSCWRDCLWKSVPSCHVGEVSVCMPPVRGRSSHTLHRRRSHKPRWCSGLGHSRYALDSHISDTCSAARRASVSSRSVT